MKNNILKFVFILCLINLISCTEPFTIESYDFESVLVVEATITDENKKHTILLSKAFKISEDSPEHIENAIVKITDENNTEFTFTETSPGKYVSDIAFKAVTDINYKLSIATDDGNVYESNNSKTTSKSKIDNLSVSLEKNSLNEDEFSINVDSYDPERNSNYYKYSYEETYKIEAPYWSPLEAFISATTPPRVSIGNKIDKTKKICYNTQASNTIIQISTKDLSEDRLTKFPVRKVLASDFKVSHRYSINVRQQIQSYDAYNYYSILNKFSNASDLLSQSQPGFFNGNIKSMLNENERVLGFFEIAHVSEKRIFFNYRDFIAIGRPEYAEDCYKNAPTNSNGPGGNDLVITLQTGDWIYYAENKTVSDGYPGPYLLYPKGCGDCTIYGSNVKPDFWID